MRARKFWTDADLWRLIAWHPNMSNVAIAGKLGRTTCSINKQSGILGLEKSREYLSTIPVKSGMVEAGKAYRYPKGHVPINKGIKGWQAGGRSVETQFKKGQVSSRWDPAVFIVGAPRINGDGYIDMKIKEGSRSWRQLHLILWEDAHGPVPPGRILRFKDGDPMNVVVDNLELINRGENMRRNSIHNLPQPLKSTIQLLGQLKKTLNRRHGNEEPHRRSA